MNTDKRPDSLAAQAVAWVPPWERPLRQPEAAAGEEPPPPEEGHDVASPEVAPLPGESGGSGVVDAPVEGPEDGEAGPTEVGGVPEMPLPTPIEEAAEQAPEFELGEMVDAPLPVESDPTVSSGGPGDGDDDPEAGAFESGPAGGDAAPGGSAEAATFRHPVPTQGRGSQGPVPAVVDSGARTPGFSSDEGDHPPAVTLMDDAELRAALEAILLVVDEPVAEMQLAQIMEQPTERVAAMLEDISARYTAAGHGFDLRRAAGGWRLYTRPEYAPYVERFVLDGQSVRLTQAALETLAVVAYKQPVTRSRISAIRGVNCDGVMRTLVTRGLIEECGIEGETGAYLYRTTPLFLEKLGLNSVDQLPPLAPFLPDDVEEVLDASG